MIRCHLGRLLGDRKLKISDVVRDTGINRGTLTRLYYEKTERVEFEALDRLCEYFGCSIHDLLEYVPGAAGPVPPTSAPTSPAMKAAAKKADLARKVRTK